MLDLQKGILPVEGFTLKPEASDGDLYAPAPEAIDSHGRIVISANTTLADMQGVYEENAFNSIFGGIVTLKMLFLVDGKPFNCTFYFDKDDRICSVKLVPCIRYTAEKWDRAARQEERRVFCDQWLLAHLGAPAKNVSGAEYELDGLRIVTVTHFDQIHGADAGYISVTYCPKG